MFARVKTDLPLFQRHLEEKQLEPTPEDRWHTRVAMPVAIYRGGECPTLKNSRKGCEVGPVNLPVKEPKNSRKKQPKQSKQLFSGVLAVFRLFAEISPGTHWPPFSAVFRLFQSRAFGTCVDGHRDCNTRAKGWCECKRAIYGDISTHHWDCKDAETWSNSEHCLQSSMALHGNLPNIDAGRRAGKMWGME